MIAGDKALLRIPSIVHSRYEDNVTWLAAVRAHDGETVTIHSQCEMLATKEAAYKTNILTPSGAFRLSIPAVWLFPVVAEAKKEEVILTVGTYCQACGGYDGHRLMCPEEA